LYYWTDTILHFVRKSLLTKLADPRPATAVPIVDASLASASE